MDRRMVLKRLEDSIIRIPALLTIRWSLDTTIYEFIYIIYIGSTHTHTHILYSNKPIQILRSIFFFRRFIQMHDETCRII